VSVRVSAHCPGWHGMSNYDKGNMEAARLILADAQRFPEGSLARRWAELWHSRHGEQKQSGMQLALFEERAA
jgi:hypothetical protein